MITPEQIRCAVDAYLCRHPGDANRIATLSDAFAASDDLASRATFTGHVTCSAVVLDPGRHVLHIRHNALGKWLCPGGHLDPGDTSLAAAALREVTEETGIEPSALALHDATPIDIDVHPIPANLAKGEPDHQHFDLRYAFITATRPEIHLQADEVHDFAWLPVTQLADNESLVRLPARMRKAIMEALHDEGAAVQRDDRGDDTLSGPSRGAGCLHP